MLYALNVYTLFILALGYEEKGMQKCHRLSEFKHFVSILFGKMCNIRLSEAKCRSFQGAVDSRPVALKSLRQALLAMLL